MHYCVYGGQPIAIVIVYDYILDIKCFSPN